MSARFAALAGMMALVAACATEQNADSDTSAMMADSPAAEAAAPAPTPGVTDANIAAIVVAANTVDVKAGEQAVKKATDADVKAFANQMIVDHSGVNKAAVALVTKLGVTPEENDLSRQLTANGETTRNKLDGMSGAEFDKAYIDNEVAYHQAVIDALNSTLIPSAQNAELKQTLVTVLPNFEAHLVKAKQIQAKLGGSSM
jgi:putative membrane protein